MSITAIAAVGMVAVLLAVQMKGIKNDYGVYLIIAAEVFIFLYGIGKLKNILEGIQRIEEMIKINQIYLTTFLKMAGMTYVAEFASGICKDSGYGAMGNQIEIFGKLSILAVSMPVILALLSSIQEFLT